MMGTSTELLGKELARQIHMLYAMKEERREKMTEFKLREQTMMKEIHRLVLDVRTGQSHLFGQEERP